jgi:hypothetical protein
VTAGFHFRLLKLQLSGHEQLECREQTDALLAGAGFSQTLAIVPNSVALVPNTNSTVSAVNSRILMVSLKW